MSKNYKVDELWLFLADNYDVILLDSELTDVKEAAIKSIKICTGCGHFKMDPINPPHLTCCPDSRYVDVRSYVDHINLLNSQRYHKMFNKKKS